MPKPKLSRRSSLIVLYLSHFLERFSYYGSRAILVLYLIAEDGLGIDSTEALEIYGFYSSLIHILPLFLGLVTDFLLKRQRYAIALGGSFALLGYLALLGDSLTFVYIGLIGISVGTSWVKPSLNILVGRLFTKDDRRRNVAFFGVYAMVNLGAFATSLITTLVAEEYSWIAGFELVAASTLIYLVLFLVIKEGFPIIESNNKEESGENGDDAVATRLIPSDYWVFIIGISMSLTLYWGFIETGIIKMTSISDSKLASSSSIFTMPLLIAIGSYAFFAPLKFPSKITLYGIGFILGGIGLAWVSASEASIGLATVLGVNFVFSVSEVFLSPLALSWVTRISDVRYSSTMYGLYILPFSLSRYLVIEDIIQEGLSIYILAGILGIIGLLLLLFRRKLKSRILLD